MFACLQYNAWMITYFNSFIICKRLSIILTSYVNDVKMIDADNVRC